MAPKDNTIKQQNSQDFTSQVTHLHYKKLTLCSPICFLIESWQLFLRTHSTQLNNKTGKGKTNSSETTIVEKKLTKKFGGAPILAVKNHRIGARCHGLLERRSDRSMWVVKAIIRQANHLQFPFPCFLIYPQSLGFLFLPYIKEKIQQYIFITALPAQKQGGDFPAKTQSLFPPFPHQFGLFILWAIYVGVSSPILLLTTVALISIFWLTLSMCK